jgi:uncharacterized membrane protein (UPF0127 family)
MTRLRVANETRSGVLGCAVELADTVVLRLRGYLGRPAPREGEGLLITPCRAVHMYGMRYPLDVIFLDRDGRVLALYPSLEPWSHTRWHGHAEYALELPPGSILASRTHVDDIVIWRPVREHAGAPERSGPSGTRSRTRRGAERCP